MSSTELGTEGRARLLRKAQAAAGLNHPNIVSVHDAGEARIPGRVEPADPAELDAPLPFVVMELVEGPSLHVRRPGSLEETVAVALQVCAALEHAHSRGIVHRDLKPENVLLTLDPLAGTGPQSGAGRPAETIATAAKEPLSEARRELIHACLPLHRHRGLNEALGGAYG